MTRIFCTGSTRAAKAGQQICCTGTGSPSNQPRKNSFHIHVCTPWVPICHSFKSQQGSPLSSLSEHRKMYLYSCTSSYLNPPTSHSLQTVKTKARARRRRKETLIIIIWRFVCVPADVCFWGEVILDWECLSEYAMWLWSLCVHYI